MEREGAMDQVTMRIDGMSCAHCVKAVRDALAELPGVEVERVDVGSATVRIDPAVTQRAQVAEAVRDAGYEPAEA
jgi:copper chaperone